MNKSGEPAFMQERSAGILMHITSLASPYGIGDFGEHARGFADFLHDAGQTYWQILPLNPISASQAFSPYSSVSAMALNTLLISPEQLMREGLLSSNDLKRFSVPVKPRCDFRKAQQIKTKVLDLAFHNYQKSDQSNLTERFNTFVWQEAEWLEDYSVFTVLKKVFKEKPWFKWPDDIRKRKPSAIAEVFNRHGDEIERVKWEQFIAFQQWKQLKDYSRQMGISFVGDLPFYVGHDSADVWAHQSNFKLTKEGMMKGVAGVPPDYFNADGQLWGMPVYDWKQLKDENYAWWMQRLKKNVELFDVVRLDHFRAFADYWEIPAHEKTARKGKWIDGPGEDFFRVANSALGTLPFIAEDLGDISEKVLELRDALSLPGMKILQFAFDSDSGTNAYLPHNYTNNFIVYTGTHDNNTTVGWFAKDIDSKQKKVVQEYLNTEVNKSNVHQHLIRHAYASVARMAIIPMQDVLGLDASARMNTPASVKNNWSWRMSDQRLRAETKFLKKLALLYRR